jgi:NAD(P)-dependent dehydrogenase (short-subunit alcohol dehydrogenase family)
MGARGRGILSVPGQERWNPSRQARRLNIITGRRQSELDLAARQIGKNVTGVQGDVSKLADLDRLYATVKQEKGQIDILFANAGAGEIAALGAISEEHPCNESTNVRTMFWVSADCMF